MHLTFVQALATFQQKQRQLVMSRTDEPENAHRTAISLSRPWSVTSEGKGMEEEKTVQREEGVAK